MAHRRRCTGALLCLLLAAASLAPSRARADDPMTAYRERFKMGLERYKAGNVAEALRYWEPIYRELGASKGYRLAYDLARAYETYGDFTRAAELYASFLSEVETRRPLEKLVPIVEDEEIEARARLAELARSKGRIKVLAGASAVAVRIDADESRVAGFVAYVPPGPHEVVFGVGDGAERRQVTVGAGEIVEVEPPLLVAPPPAPPAATALVPAVRTEHRIEHPFAPGWIYVGVALTAASVVVPVITYESALSYRDANKLSSDPGSDAKNAAIRAEYGTRTTEFHAALAIPITLAAATAALTVWYFAGAQGKEVPVVVPAASATKEGASLSLSGSF